MNFHIENMRLEGMSNRQKNSKVKKNLIKLVLILFHVFVFISNVINFIYQILFHLLIQKNKKNNCFFKFQLVLILNHRKIIQNSSLA